VELERDYALERADKLDERLSKIEKRLARIAPVNMAKTIENPMRDCMEKMVEQVTDQVVGKLEKLAEKEKREETRRGKQVEATPESDGKMSDIAFEPGATFLEEANEKVPRVLERMEVEEQELEASKHAPVILPGEKRQEFLRFTPSGQGHDCEETGYCASSSGTKEEGGEKTGGQGDTKGTEGWREEAGG